MAEIKNRPLLVATLVLLGAFLGWWWLWVPVFIWYGLYKPVWWLVVIIVAVDAYYGSFYSVPLLSIGSFIGFLLLEIIRPQLYTTDTSHV